MTAREPGPNPRYEKLSDDVDIILDEVQEVVEDNAEEFVRSYVQKGGQGWSTFVDPSFFVGAATASIAASVTYDAFKKVIAKVIEAINKVPGPVETIVYEADGSFNGDFELVIGEAWETANSVFRQSPAEHTIGEATALHWAMFTKELLAQEPLVRLSPNFYERLRRAGTAHPAQLTPTQLVAMIVSQWLARNPNAEIGIWE